MASVLPRPLSWVAPPHVRLPGPRRDLCPSPRDRTRPSVSWAGSRSFRVPTSPRHPGLRPRQRRPPPAKGRGSCPRLDARSCRASGLSPRREPSPLPRSQRRALTVTFPTGSSTHPQASPGPGSPTSPGGTRGAPRATALWDRRWLPGNPGPPAISNTPECARGTIASHPPRTERGTPKPHKGSWALPRPGPQHSGLHPPWSPAPEGQQHTRRPTAGWTATAERTATGRLCAERRQPQAPQHTPPPTLRPPVLPGPTGTAGQRGGGSQAASSPSRGMWWKPLPGTTGLRDTAQEFTLNNF